MDEIGRKRPCHTDDDLNPGGPTLIFLTVCVLPRERVLDNAVAYQLLPRVWKECSWWRVGRFVLMPDHLHLFCTPAETSGPLRQWVKSWKSRVSKGWPGGFRRPVWQRDCWDTQLRGIDSYEQKWQYVRDNPVRAELVAKPEDWPWQGEIEALDW